MAALAELFPSGDYRFHLTLRRGEPAEFFRPADASGKILAERARWLAEAPVRYAALTPEGEPLLAEFGELCTTWGLSAPADVIALGATLEPDVLLLSPDATGAFRLRGGALCFPTGWALEEKLGRTMDFIHGVVPGLNAALASPIHQFLSRLKPGVAFYRDNWGIAATDELNLHPARALPPPVLPVRLDRLWLRVEHQSLLALPRTGGVVFGLRIALHRLDQVKADAGIARSLAQALDSMPADLAAYKRLDVIRADLIKTLQA
ncbi:MAG: DUF3445 domain-containing protein [Verrucomicrobia bacterium]|nr:DUF3445 domain-containing protein [Verrucomicrobiota bacterium]